MAQMCEVQKVIQQEVDRPNKQWIHSVIRGEQEAESVRIRTPDYVVLPDTEKLNRHWRSMYVC